MNDADVKVTATSQIAQMYIRKQNIYTERKIYPYVKMEDLRLDLLPKLRVMAANNSGSQSHPWIHLTDEELLKSMRLYSVDRLTGEAGFNLAAIMLLGKDEVIADVVPAYVTDALCRVVDQDRYDDREIIKTNLIERYERLMNFGHKHLPDRFYLEKDQRISIRDIITREMIANTLIHREYTSAYQAKFVIEKDCMYTENANRVSQEAILTEESIMPNPKNPIIASFFWNIGYADQLGSGVRNLFKYCKAYAGGDTQFLEGDVFKLTVQLNGIFMDGGGFAINNNNNQSELSLDDQDILEIMKKEPFISQKEIAERLKCNLNTVKYRVRRLQKCGLVERSGTNRNGHWIVSFGNRNYPFR